MTRGALQTHITGTSYAEIEEAASLFKGVEDNRAASTLWLGLVRLDVSTQDWEKASWHAALSQNAFPNPEALAALVLLNLKSPEDKRHWVLELRSSYPDSEISQVYTYLEQLKSFSDPLPASDALIGWVRQRAVSGKEEDLSLSQQIKDLPQEAARHIQQDELSIAQIMKEQEVYRRRYAGISAEISRLENEGLWDAIGQVIYKLLPLPEPGDTWETYLAREGLCALPIIKYFCALFNLKPLFELRQNQQEATDSRARVAEIISLNESVISNHRSDIRYWQSSEPLEKLVHARESLIPSFRGDVEQNLLARREQVGLSVLEALTIAAH